MKVVEGENEGRVESSKVGRDWQSRVKGSGYGKYCAVLYEKSSGFCDYLNFGDLDGCGVASPRVWDFE